MYRKIRMVMSSENMWGNTYGENTNPQLSRIDYGASSINKSMQQSNNISEYSSANTPVNRRTVKPAPSYQPRVVPPKPIFRAPPPPPRPTQSPQPHSQPIQLLSPVLSSYFAPYTAPVHAVSHHRGYHAPSAFVSSPTSQIGVAAGFVNSAAYISSSPVPSVASITYPVAVASTVSSIHSPLPQKIVSAYLYP